MLSPGIQAALTQVFARPDVASCFRLVTNRLDAAALTKAMKARRPVSLTFVLGLEVIGGIVREVTETHEVTVVEHLDGPNGAGFRLQRTTEAGMLQYIELTPRSLDWLWRAIEAR